MADDPWADLPYNGTDYNTETRGCLEGVLIGLLIAIPFWFLAALAAYYLIK